jgi:protoporphyrinogen oxidase
MNGYVPATDLHQLLTGAFSLSSEAAGYNAQFNYPVTGGIEALIKVLTLSVMENVSAENEVVEIDSYSKSITLKSGSQLKYSKLISTMPLKELIKKSVGVPEEITNNNDLLQCSGVYNINLAIKGVQLPNTSWVYFPEKKYVFYRVGFYSSFALRSCQPGTTSVYVEIAYRHSIPDKEALYNQTINQLKEIGIISSFDDIIECCILDIPYAYVTYDHNWQQSRKRVHEWLRKRDIISIGRYGSWEYSDMEASMLQAKHTVEEILH